MKKHLIAAAVAAAVSAPAMAQNVSVYGIIDAGIQSYDNGVNSYQRSTNNVIATSRIGFRGTEDLGGGLKANFQLEATLAPNEGQAGTTATVTNSVSAASTLFNREAWVGLSGGFGEIRFGRQDVTYAQDIDSGVSKAGNLIFSNMGSGVLNGELGADQNGVIKYISPKVAGFNVELGYTAGNATGATADGDVPQYGAFAQYNQGPLRVMLGYHKTDGLTSVAEQDMVRLGAAYDFGVASVGYVYTKADVSTTADTKLKFHTATATMPLSNGLAVHVVYGKGEDEGTANAKGDGYTLALTKALSKRTTLYGAYTQVDNEAQGKFALTGVTSMATAGADTSAVTVGVVHSF